VVGVSGARQDARGARHWSAHEGRSKANRVGGEPAAVPEMGKKNRQRRSKANRVGGEPAAVPEMGKKNRQRWGSSFKVPLLDSEEWLSAQLLRALQIIFQRFDVDRDGTLNPAELQAFARACNDGTELDVDELDQIQDYFDTDGSSALTLRGFHEMYQMQTRSRSARRRASPATPARHASPPPPPCLPAMPASHVNPSPC